MLDLLAAGDPMEHILPHVLYRTGVKYTLFGHEYTFSITNQMLMAVVAAVLMLLIFPTLFRKASSDAPSGAKNFFESILTFLREEVFRPALKDKTDRFVPFLWTLFFFILFCNLLGQLPIAEIVSLITGKTSHIGGTATGNVNTTGALAVCTFIMIHLAGIMQIARDLVTGAYGHHGHEAHADANAHGHTEHGHQPAHETGMNPLLAGICAVPLYFWNFAPHPFKPQPGGSPIGWVVDIPLWIFLLALELIGAVIKPFALMIRLFANMIAGHLVLAVLIGFIAVMPTIMGQIGISLPVSPLLLLIRILELFVAFLQAYIFTFLATLFIQAAVAPEH